MSGNLETETPVILREAVLTDVPAIIAIDASITGVEKPEIWYGYIREFSSEKRAFMVATVADQVVGYIVGEVRAWEFGSPPCGWISAVSVHPQYRLAGIGTKLIDVIRQRFRHAGITTIRTMLQIDDHLLMSFFRSHGMAAGPFVELEMPLDPNNPDPPA